MHIHIHIQSTHSSTHIHIQSTHTSTHIHTLYMHTRACPLTLCARAHTTPLLLHTQHTCTSHDNTKLHQEPTSSKSSRNVPTNPSTYPPPNQSRPKTNDPQTQNLGTMKLQETAIPPSNTHKPTQVHMHNHNIPTHTGTHTHTTHTHTYHTHTHIPHTHTHTTHTHNTHTHTHTHTYQGGSAPSSHA